MLQPSSRFNQPNLGNTCKVCETKYDKLQKPACKKRLNPVLLYGKLFSHIGVDQNSWSANDQWYLFHLAGSIICFVLFLQWSSHVIGSFDQPPHACLLAAARQIIRPQFASAPYSKLTSRNLPICGTSHMRCLLKRIVRTDPALTLFNISGLWPIMSAKAAFTWYRWKETELYSS